MAHSKGTHTFNEPEGDGHSFLLGKVAHGNASGSKVSVPFTKAEGVRPLHEG